MSTVILLLAGSLLTGNPSQSQAVGLDGFSLVDTPSAGTATEPFSPDDTSWKQCPRLLTDLERLRDSWKNPHFNVDYLEYLSQLSMDNCPPPEPGLTPSYAKRVRQRAESQGLSDWMTSPLLLSQLASLAKSTRNPHYNVNYVRYLSERSDPDQPVPPPMNPGFARQVITAARKSMASGH